MFDLRWLRSLARLVSDWLWKNVTASSTALATLRPVARWFCEVPMFWLIWVSESRFWRVARPRTMLLDIEFILSGNDKGRFATRRWSRNRHARRRSRFPARQLPQSPRFSPKAEGAYAAAPARPAKFAGRGLPARQLFP